MHLLLGALLHATLTPDPDMWRGTVKVHGMIYEPGGYHPYTTLVSLYLREGERTLIPGGFRVSLVSEDSVYDVQTSVYQSDGLLICSGTGAETLTGATIGYLETKGGRTVYHLAMPRAFGAFACGRNRRVRADRVVIIGRGDYEARSIETEDTAVRALEGGAMEGSWESSKTRGAVRYEYSVSWSISREPPER